MKISSLINKVFKEIEPGQGTGQTLGQVENGWDNPWGKTPDLSHNGKPAEPTNAPELETVDCGLCPAAGYWDYRHYAGHLLCFYTAYYLGKAGKPKPCAEVKDQCPKLNHLGTGEWDKWQDL